MTAIGAVTAALVTAAFASPGGSCTENAFLVFDASGSMGVEYGGQVKLETARRAVSAVLPDVSQHRRTGLVTYAGCSRVELRVQPARNTADEILAALAQTRARGDTPLTRAVALAHKKLVDMGEPGIVVLVTDGLESCNDDPCRFSKGLPGPHYEIPIHVIGFALAPEPGPAQLRCLTRATGGTFANASSLTELQDALRRVLGCPMLSWYDWWAGRSVNATA